MANLITKTFNFIGKLTKQFLTGEFAMGFYTLSTHLPNWLFRFNKATILLSENLTFPESINPEIRVKIADHSDIDEINRISTVEPDHIAQMLDNGAVCFIAALGENRFSSVAWAALGKSYVRGMSYLFDFGENCHYTFGLFTLPDARKKGINLTLLSASVNYAIQKNITKFYSMVEFTNHYALKFHEKLGYHHIGYIKLIKIFFITISTEKDIIKNKSSVKFQFRDIKGDFPII